MIKSWRMMATLLLVLLLLLTISLNQVWQQMQRRADGDLAGDVTPMSVAAVATPTLAPTVTAPIPTAIPTATPLPTPVPITIREIELFPIDPPPIIDGDIGEWSYRVGVTTPFITEQLLSWDGTFDIQANWRLGWDEENFYLAVVVVDDIYEQSQIVKYAYYGDSLEIQLDTDLAGDYGPLVNQDDFQYLLSAGDFLRIPPGIFRFQGDEDHFLTDALGSNGRIAAQKTEDGYIIEAAIPWSDFNVTPEVGLRLGIALSSNDNDQPGSVEQQFMVSHVSSRLWLDPTSWGEMVLR